MKLVVSNDGIGERAEVIDLHRRRDAAHCLHWRLLIDEAAMDVTCKDCGDKINAVWALSRFATEQSLWRMQREQVEAALKKLAARSRFTCRHCGRISKVKS